MSEMTPYKQLYEDLTGAIDRIIAQTPQLPLAAEERENQRFLAKRHAAYVVERPAVTAQLDKVLKRLEDFKDLIETLRNID